MARSVNIMRGLVHCLLIYSKLFTQFPEVPFREALI